MTGNGTGQRCRVLNGAPGQRLLRGVRVASADPVADHAGSQQRFLDSASPLARRSSGRVWRRHGCPRQTRALAERRSPTWPLPRPGATRINPRRTRSAVPHSADDPDAPTTQSGRSPNPRRRRSGPYGSPARGHANAIPVLNLRSRVSERLACNCARLGVRLFCVVAGRALLGRHEYFEPLTRGA
jgi:hypothetical protein